MYREINEHLIFQDGVVAGENVIKLDFTSPILTSGSAITRYVDKEDGSECPNCQHSDAIGERILFIKLDAIGDVLRSASLLPSIISHHHKPYIAWLTRPERSIGNRCRRILVSWRAMRSDRPCGPARLR